MSCSSPEGSGIALYRGLRETKGVPEPHTMPKEERYRRKPDRQLPAYSDAPPTLAALIHSQSKTRSSRPPGPN